MNEKEYRHLWYLKNKDKHNRKTKEYYEKHKKEIKVKSEEYYKQNKNKIKETVKKYKQTHREKDRFWKHEWEKKNRQKKNAHLTIYRAIKKGLIKSPREYKCAICDKQATEYHHYKGYDKENWLIVMPLCTEHHKKR